MKEGDILYFVDINLCKVTKHKILEIVPPCTDGKYELVTFTGNIKTHPNCIHINPASKDYFHKNTKVWNSKKCYLVFTEVEDAHKALNDYVLPRKVETEQKYLELLRDNYFKALEKFEALEVEVKKNKENFDKKCNALKKKFV